MIEFKRDKETGIVYAYKDGKKVGPVNTMGDDVKKEKKVGDKNGKHNGVQTDR